MRLKLVEGRDPVPQEDGRPWPNEGIVVTETTLYLRRRLRDGDIEEVAEEAPADPLDPPPPAETPNPETSTRRSGRKGEH